MTQGAFGVACQIDVSGTPTTFAKIMEVNWPVFKKFIAEATTHDSTGGYYEAVDSGKFRVMPFPLILAWDTSQSTHAAVLTAFNGSTAVTFSVADPDGDETIAFECFVEEVERQISGQEGIYQARVLIHPTGQATIT
jgi:hypothetical protein